MGSGQQHLNQWILIYISQYKLTKSRYEIDSCLLKAGCNPQDIELVWEHLKSKEQKVRPDAKRRNQRELAVFIGSCTLIGLPFLLPLTVDNNTTPHLIPILFCLSLLGVSGSSFIGLIKWVRQKTQAHSKISLFLMGTFITLPIAVLLYCSFAFIYLLERDYYHDELTNRNAQNGNYRLVWEHGCAITCVSNLQFFRCNNASIESCGYLGNVYTQDIKDLQPDKQKLILQIKDNGLISLLADGKEVYVFKNKRQLSTN